MATTGQMLDIAEGEGTPMGTPPPSEAEPTKAAPSLGDQWKTFLSQPGNAAAAIQFGIKAMQPVSPGQSIMGHIGNALGSAGEAKQRVTQSRTDEALKRAQTDYYGQRTNTLATGGGLTAAARLNWMVKQDAAYGEILDQVAFNTYGKLGWADLDPTTLAEAEALAKNLYAQRYGKAPPEMADPALAGGTPSLGATTAAPAVTRTDTQGRKWTIQNGQWVQTG